MEDNIKILKVENHDLWILRGKLEENSEEISSVALLSPACFHLGLENLFKLSLNYILIAVNKLIFISEIYKQILFVFKSKPVNSFVSFITSNACITYVSLYYS